ncbi:MAG: hypothetical protein FWB90_02475 [Fibromonadales bacterium]|nr:hypothetical protein [Fibromonadales bacterium]
MIRCIFPQAIMLLMSHLLSFCRKIIIAAINIDRQRIASSEAYSSCEFMLAKSITGRAMYGKLASGIFDCGLRFLIRGMMRAIAIRELWRLRGRWRE